jgi:thiosulfate/3-mercaptopyruvate sulfurtransferase
MFRIIRTPIARVAGIVIATIALVTPCAAQRAADLLVPMDWVRAHLDDPTVAIVQVGSEAAFDAGHIPGARVIGRDAVMTSETRQLPDAKDLADALARAGARDGVRIVLYGSEPMLTGWVFGALTTIGHGDHVALLDGNLQGWKAAGYPIATGAAEPAAGRLTVRTLPGSFVVDAPWVRANLTNAGIRLVDVRTPREWQQGMIPGAEPLLWQDFFADLPNGRFKSPEDIREVFSRAGVAPDKTVVTYCAIGMRASLAYFAARVAGLPARVYRDSWADWSKQEGYPTKK